jgi:hypothetical protein
VKYLLLLLILFSSSSSAYGQITTFSLPPAWKKAGTNMKTENASTVAWRLNSVSNESQICVYSNSGQKRFEISVVPLLSNAITASVPDVSIGKSGRLAASVVAVNREGRAAALLLIFSSDGKLQSAVALDPSREISRLAVDGDDSIWALSGDGNGELIARYDSKGNEIAAFVQRSDLPEIGEGIDGNLDHGFTSLGVDGDRIWFWLPASLTYVSVRRDGSGLSKQPVSSLERPSGASSAATPKLFRSVNLADGTSVVQLVWVGENRRDLTAYVRAPGTSTWKIDSRGASGRLIGTDGSKLAFVFPESPDPTVDWR